MRDGAVWLAHRAHNPKVVRFKSHSRIHFERSLLRPFTVFYAALCRLPSQFSLLSECFRNLFEGKMRLTVDVWVKSNAMAWDYTEVLDVDIDGWGIRVCV